MKYKFITEAFISDYYKNTIGEFKYLMSDKDPIKIIDVLKKKRYIPLYLSERHGKPSSYYMSDNKKNWLIRISDHWSNSNIKNVNVCGYIGNCLWTLNSDKKVVIPKEYKWNAGIIEINKLKRI